MWSIANEADIGAKRNRPLARPIVMFLLSSPVLFGKPKTKNSAASHQADVRYNAGARIEGLIANKKAQDITTIA